MKLVEFFDSAQVRLPLSERKGMNFACYLKAVFKQYLDLVDRLDDEPIARPIRGSRDEIDNLGAESLNL